MHPADQMDYYYRVSKLRKRISDVVGQIREDARTQKPEPVKIPKTIEEVRALSPEQFRNFMNQKEPRKQIEDLLARENQRRQRAAEKRQREAEEAIEQRVEFLRG